METDDRTMNGDDNELVVAALEHDQLSGAVKMPLPRRRMTRLQLAVLWSLRVYVLFMMAVVVYQIWATTR